MPVTFLERVPIPSLRVYLSFSVMLLSTSVYYAMNMTSNPDWRKFLQADAAPSDGEPISLESVPVEIALNKTTSLRRFVDAGSFMIQEPFCIWTLINLCVCLMVCVGTGIQRAVFGELRVSERQNVKDKFWNFVFYKFIFVFGVINVQYMDEVVLWCAWFCALGFLHLLVQLCKDRFEYLSFSSSCFGWAGARLAALLSVVLALSVLLLVLCGCVAFRGDGFNTFAFMSAECILLCIRTSHVLFRYGMHIMEARQAEEANSEDDANSETQTIIVGPRLNENGLLVDENGLRVNPDGTRIGLGRTNVGRTSQMASQKDSRAPFAHYAELGFELAGLGVDLAHHVHMLIWSNIFLSMASLVICMQLRYLFHEIRRKVKKHRNYMWVLNHMEAHYPMASISELNSNGDNCAICWERMLVARKLPCGHLFHSGCLSSWLQQDTSCPTCRLALSLWPPPPPPPTHSAAPNHLFHFDGSRYVSWLPSFSVEVTHMMRPPPPHNTTSQLESMARQVQQLFPGYPLTTITLDLQISRSMDATVENILDGRLQPQPDHLPPPEQASSPAPLEEVTPTEHHEEDESHSVVAVTTTATVPRFSLNSAERERILRRKKEQLLFNARRKFMDRQAKPNTSTGGAQATPDKENQHHEHTD